MKQPAFASWGLAEVEQAPPERFLAERCVHAMGHAACGDQAELPGDGVAEPHADTAGTWLYESESMRRFALLDLADDAMPDGTAILRFGYMLERNASYVGARLFMNESSELNDG